MASKVKKERDIQYCLLI